jgi:tRNA(Ile)-lysidine synthase
MPRPRRSASAADSAVAAAPLTLGEVAAALAAIGGFEAAPLIAVAVSGGPDSLALAILAERWAQMRGGRAWGLIVDHRLRPESATEARIVAGWLAARGIAHDILVWIGAKPASGVQEAARAARYRLLGDWCRARGILHLLTAHHREDQAETHQIRRRAGSGVDGLAAMSAVRELPGLRLLRPLLATPKARLAAVLAAEGQPFISDPSNRDPRFERSRLRLDAARTAGVSPASAAGGTPAVQLEIGAFGRLRIERERELDRLIGRAVQLHPAGFAALDPAALTAVEPEMAERLLGRIAATIGGAPYPARRERLARLRAGLRDAPGRARTLGGCRFVPWRDRILVMRELAAAAAPARLPSGTQLTWDNRFAIDVPVGAVGLTLGYLGQAEGIGREHRAMAERGDLPRLLDRVLPALWDAAGLAAVPHLGYRRGDVSALPRLAFRPANPLTMACFTVV